MRFPPCTLKSASSGPSPTNEHPEEVPDTQVAEGRVKDLSVSQSLLCPGTRTYGPNLLPFGSYHQGPPVTYPRQPPAPEKLWVSTG